MADPKKFYLQITAGPSYDPSSHKLVHVNTAETIDIESEHLSAKLSVRIQNFRGLPHKSPQTSPYFSHPLHTSSLYSIAFTFTPKRDIEGSDVLFGNDFEKPIRDNLPPGFGAALRIVRWAIDPGLDGDVYADHPYLYGPFLSSINVLWIGDKEGDEDAGKANQDNNNNNNDNDESLEERDQYELESEQLHPHRSSQHDTDPRKDDAPPPSQVLTEGGSSPHGVALRESAQIPADSAARMKHFLTASHRQEFKFEKGREYSCDFFNPYLDFNDLSLKLPGVSWQLMRYWDGQPLRYTLKERKEDKSVDRELLVVVFTLVSEEEVEAQEKKWRGVSGTGKGSGRRAVDMAGMGGGGGNAGSSQADVD